MAKLTLIVHKSIVDDRSSIDCDPDSFSGKLNLDHFLVDSDAVLADEVTVLTSKGPLSLKSNGNNYSGQVIHGNKKAKL